MFSAQEPTSIQKMFNQIAGKYDLANTVLSLGTHLIWKKLLVREARVQPGMKVLDCATGTGDIAFLFEKETHGRAEITGIDFSEKMLEEARKRADELESLVHFEFADIENLPFPSQYFDLVTISFGIRNVANTRKGLQELARVTKPGGRILVLEFGQPSTPVFKQLYSFYSNKVLPTVGGMISGEKGAYKYLNESSSQFPCGDDFLAMARELNAFTDVTSKSLSLGIAYLYQLKV